MMEETKIPKKKYKKHITEGKINIMPFLNYALKPRLSNDGEKLYPLYIQITVKRQLARIKSRIDDNMLSNIEYEKVMNNLARIGDKVIDDDISKMLIGSDKIINISSDIHDEINLIRYILQGMRPFEMDNFEITAFTSIFFLYSMKLKEFASAMFAKNMMKILAKEANQSSKNYLETIDWSKDVLNIWSLLSEEFTEINRLKEIFPVSFKLLFPNNTLMSLNEDENYFFGKLSQKYNFISVMEGTFKDDYIPKSNLYYTMLDDFRNESNKIMQLK